MGAAAKSRPLGAGGAKTPLHGASYDLAQALVPPGTRVVKTLAPGRAGARRLAQRFGARLVCVRHRRDRLGLYRYVTVELVVDARARRPRAFAVASFGVELGDDPPDALTTLLTDGGARWDRRERLWWVKGALIERLGLVARIRRM